MFDYYDHVNAAAVWGPWILTVLFLFLWAAQIRAYRNQGEDLDAKENDSQDLKALKGFIHKVIMGKPSAMSIETAERIKSEIDALHKATAEARELKTALDECGNKLDKTKKELELANAVNALSRPTPLLSTPAILGNPAKKVEKKAPVKKLTKSLAKAKARK